MTFGSRRQWSAIGFLALTACNAEGTANDKASELQSAGASSADSAFAEAGQGSLSDEQLDRLLDALESELQTQESRRR